MRMPCTLAARCLRGRRGSEGEAAGRQQQQLHGGAGHRRRERRAHRGAGRRHRTAAASLACCRGGCGDISLSLSSQAAATLRLRFVTAFSKRATLLPWGQSRSRRGRQIANVAAFEDLTSCAGRPRSRVGRRHRTAAASSLERIVVAAAAAALERLHDVERSRRPRERLHGAPCAA